MVPPESVVGVPVTLGTCAPGPHRYIHPSTGPPPRVVRMGARDETPLGGRGSAGGEEAADGAGAGGLPPQAELVVDVLEVPLDGPHAQGERAGDGGVVASLG